MRGNQGLTRAVEEYLTEWSERTGVTVEVWAMPGAPAGDVHTAASGAVPDVAPGAVPDVVPAAVAEAVYAVLVEALGNVERHSRAQAVSIALTVGRSGLRLTISDNGAGFRPGRTGRGLDMMKRRFREVGGTLTINSVVGEGTTISGTI
ncbi:sensor histidine kinase [Sphaerisporangium rufum]|nr:ATP-binding protein [Sphaerisporangium rufum]